MGQSTVAEALRPLILITYRPSRTNTTVLRAVGASRRQLVCGFVGRGARPGSQPLRRGSPGAGQTTLVAAFFVFRFEIVHARRGNRQPRVLRALDELLLLQIPERELDVLPGRPEQLLEIEQEDTRRVGFGEPLHVENF